MTPTKTAHRLLPGRVGVQAEERAQSCRATPTSRTAACIPTWPETAKLASKHALDPHSHQSPQEAPGAATTPPAPVALAPTPPSMGPRDAQSPTSARPPTPAHAPGVPGPKAGLGLFVHHPPTPGPLLSHLLETSALAVG